MAEQNPTTVHQAKVGELADQGWSTRGFRSFLFSYQFARRILDYCPSPPAKIELAGRLQSEITGRHSVGRRKLAPTIRRLAESAGRPMSADEIIARMRRFECTDWAEPRFIPDAWRLAGDPGIVLEVAEVSDTHPLFRDRLYAYSRLNDWLPDCGISGIRLFEVSARSGAWTEHDLPGMLVDACLHAKENALR